MIGHYPLSTRKESLHTFGFLFTWNLQQEKKNQTHVRWTFQLLLLALLLLHVQRSWLHFKPLRNNCLHLVSFKSFRNNTFVFFLPQLKQQQSPHGHDCRTLPTHPPIDLQNKKLSWKMVPKSQRATNCFHTQWGNWDIIGEFDLFTKIPGFELLWRISFASYRLLQKGKNRCRGVSGCSWEDRSESVQTGSSWQHCRAEWTANVEEFSVLPFNVFKRECFIFSQVASPNQKHMLRWLRRPVA